MEKKERFLVIYEYLHPPDTTTTTKEHPDGAIVFGVMGTTLKQQHNGVVYI